MTTMSLSAILTTYGFGLAYFAATGTYFFIDTYIPVAVFLGMLLLFVDPATAPRTELGRIIFGALYGASTVGLYALLESDGRPTFYDKLLQMPFMNLSVQADGSSGALAQAGVAGSASAGRSRRPTAPASWRTRPCGSSSSAAMSFAQGVGDHHPGHRLPFWQRACEQNLHNGCRTLASIESTLCSRGSGWACNEQGVMLLERRKDSPQVAVAAFQRACATGFAAGCQNALLAERGAIPARALPAAADFAILLREGKGALPR